MLTRTVHFPSVGNFFVPAEPEERSRASEACARAVLQLPLGEYSYPRDAIEDVETVLDVGCNLGAFAVWACHVWWPGRIVRVYGYDPNVSALAIAQRNTRGWPVELHPLAVTCDSRPVFLERTDWGSSRTHGETSGVPVLAIHPSRLPAADVLKVDGEGVDLEVFEHYAHWDGVRVALFEWHECDHRAAMFEICKRAGLELRKNDCGEAEQGVACWVRP